jgi:anaerobic magnesium-protoporphyrin IX monomethyl ester cyclase
MKAGYDILLIRQNYEGVYTSFKTSAKVQTCTPPTGLLAVAAGIRKAGLSVKVLDLELQNRRPEELRRLIKAARTSIIGVTATTPEIAEVVQLLDFVKKHRPDITTIMGGPHPTVLPEDAISYPSVDIIFKGEGDVEFANVVKAVKQGASLKQVNGISYKIKGKTVHNLPAAVIDDLDSLPFPARDLIDSSKYVWPVRGKGLVPGATVITTRGCPYRCAFCTKVFGPKTRFRSPDSVIAELKEIKHKYGISFITFTDDTFTLRKDRVIEICKRMVDEKLDMTWYAMVRANTADAEMFRWMRKAGCNRITMGVESGNQKILDILKKGTTLKQYVEGYRMAKRAGFETRGSFILGNPYDTRKTIRQTIEFAKRLDIDEAYFNIMTPYPATEVYEMAKRGEGLRLIEHDWKNFRRWGNAVIELDGISSSDLVKLQKRALREFYFRPHIVWTQVRRMGLVDTVKTGFRYITAFF